MKNDPDHCLSYPNANQEAALMFYKIDAEACIKEIHSVQWHGMNYEQMIASGVSILRRHLAATPPASGKDKEEA